MQKYTYKNSGIEWLGDIPKHWRVSSLKRVLSGALKYGANESAELEDRNLPRYIRITDFGHNGKLKENTFKSLPLEKAINYPLSEGDILFARSGATVGKTFQFKNYNGIACYAGYLIKATPCKWIIDSDFLYFFTKSIGYDEWKNLIFTQATIQNIGADKYQYLPLSVPPLEEQKDIVKYLDEATTRIDRIIAIKQEQLVKMKASLGKKINEIIKRGVKDFERKKSRKDFIGEIPKHYKVQKLKHITTKITDGAHFTPNYLDAPDENSIPFLRVTDVQVETIDLNRTKFIDTKEHNELIKRCNPEKGDLLLSKNGTIGITKVVDWDWDFSIFVSLCLIKPDRQLNVDYLNYFFKSEIMDIQIKNGSKQITVTNLHLDKIRDFYIVTPPIDEQILIVEKLKNIEQKFNDSLANIKSQIKTLKAYRKSLIHECVTGKKQISSAIKN